MKTKDIKVNNKTRINFLSMAIVFCAPYSSTVLAAEPDMEISFGNEYICAGGGHSLIRKTDGTLWVTGKNVNGQLGDGTTYPSLTWKQTLADVASVACGTEQSFAIKTDGTLWASGSNYYGQLGDGTNINTSTWKQVLTDVVSVTSGSGHSLALKADGTVWATGNDNDGALGLGTDDLVLTWTQTLTDVKAIGNGSSHSFAIKTNGTLWATGRNYNGQIGDGKKVDVSVWKQVTSASLIGRGYGYHSLLSDSATSTLKTTGYGNYGQLGSGGPSDRTTFQTAYKEIDGTSSVFNEIVTSLGSGQNHSFIVAEDNTFWSAGDNSDGQLGDGTPYDSFNFIQTATDVVSAAAGYDYTLIVKEDGSVWAVGENTNGQYGDGTTESTIFWRQVFTVN